MVRSQLATIEDNEKFGGSHRPLTTELKTVMDRRALSPQELVKKMA